MIPTTSLFVSSCIYIGAICDHFDHLIHSTNKDAEMRNETELFKKLCQSIDIHNKIYEWVNRIPFWRQIY